MDGSSSAAWMGKLVARILPPDAEGDYEYIAKPSLRRVDPQQFQREVSNSEKQAPMQPSVLEEPSRVALTTDEVRWTTIDVYLTKPNLEEEFHVHMNRASQELVANCFHRLEISCQKKLERTLSGEQLKLIKKKERSRRKQKEAPSTQQPVWIHPQNQEWDIADLVNGNFWGKVATEYAPDQVQVSVTVDLADEEMTIPITIDSCPPSLLAVRSFEDFQGRCFVGIPLVVDFDMLYATHVIVDWYVGGSLACSDSVIYTPTKDDIGQPVAVLLRPIRPGHDGTDYQEAYQFVYPVEERPDNKILPYRPDWTCGRTSEKDELRVLSFNILANEKAFMDARDHTRGLYDYCDEEFLKRNRRMPLILHEILEYQADVICLQEVDTSIFESLFLPVLKVKGYQGYYRKKMGTREGIAMFWSLETFEEVSPRDMNSYSLQGLFPKQESDCLEDWTSMKELYEFLKKDQDLKNVLTKKLGHVVQIATLTRRSPSEPKKIVVSNTHLFFHSMGHHIRLLQLFMICHQLQKERQGYPILFCGDFNSTPNSGGVRLLLDRTVPHDHARAWKHLNTFSWEEEDHEGELHNETPLKPPTISLPDSFPVLKSAYGEIPVFTHFIADFCGTLDYILTSQAASGDNKESYGLVATSWAPMPCRADIKEPYTAMPNEHWPSDHVSLLCDMKFERVDDEARD